MRPLNVLVMLDPTGLWVALVLDLDFATQAATLEEIPDAIQRAYRDRIDRARARGVDPFANARPSPDDYWRKFQRAELWRELALEGAPVFARKLAA